ncbi:MAG: (Fe-S)-binding protein [Candidatus Rokubacteria bacterium]|nr:(Fe-S)-binding protein [Candidatus Rokubacteria bacterium]
MGFDYGKYFGDITLTHDLTTRPEERTWKLTPPEAKPEPHRVVLYLGCNVLRTSHMIRTVTAVFDRLGLDYIALGGPTYCCGIIHHRQGDGDKGAGMSRRTLELFQRYQPEDVVMWCPSCIYFYDEVVGATMPFRVRHTTEFLLDRVPELTFTHPLDTVVGVHAHCVGEARQREARACRDLLASVPGVRVVDVEHNPEFGRSCTPAIPVSLGQDVWDGHVRDEIERARAVGADTLAGIYHGCQRMICGFEAEGRITIEHYLSVFARALGIEFEDTYKKYRLWGDPDRVLEDMTPCRQASGVDAARARALVEATFARRPVERGAAPS